MTASLATLLLVAAPAHPEEKSQARLTPCAVYSQDEHWSALERRYFNALTPEHPVRAVADLIQAKELGCDIVILIKNDPATLSATAETRSAYTGKVLLRSKDSSDSGENYLGRLASQIHRAFAPGTRRYKSVLAHRRAALRDIKPQ